MDTKDQGPRAEHGYRNEVSWDGGKGSQPYANRGEEEQGPAALPEVEAGDRGDASGRNLEQIESTKGFPERPVDEAPREARDRSKR